MAPLDSCQYVITNYKFRNAAFLPDPNEYTDIVANVTGMVPENGYGLRQFD